MTSAPSPPAGDWRAARTVRRGHELNAPLLAIALAPHQGPLPARQSFFATDADNVIVSAVKKDEDDDALTVRLYEWAGKKSDVHLRVPPGMAVVEETDGLERTIKP